jgi:hypothetical protein
MVFWSIHPKPCPSYAFVCFSLVAAHPLLCLWLGLSQSRVLAQNVGIGTQDPKAKLNIETLESGFLPPRLKRLHRDTIFQPESGLVIYNSEMAWPEYYNGTCWLQYFLEDCESCYYLPYHS